MSRQPESSIEPDVSWRALVFLSLQLAMIAVIIQQFDIESPAFYKLSLLVWGGFTIHALLPARFRLSFFAALGVAGAILIFGVAAAAWIGGTIFVLLLLCRAERVPRAIAILAIFAIVGVLAFVRAAPSRAPATLSFVLPILASMLMFRFFLLLDAHRGGARPPLVESFAYLFLLPNLCFTLFPVIDFKTFRRSRYNDHAARIYETGVRWVALGIVQLLVYRLVYYRLSVAPSHIAGRMDAIRYVLASYLMYLRVSGDFHMCVGILHLFGFNLPPSHNLFFLASSFTDFYRRINVYWKEFMLNVFYVPVYLRLKRRGGNAAALAGATLLVFVASWLLHSYQWFWLRGSFPIRGQDMLFWAILGGLVLAGSLVENRYGRERFVVRPKLTFRRVARRAASTIFTFVTICVLWSMWTSESLAAWRFIMKRVVAW